MMLAKGLKIGHDISPKKKKKKTSGYDISVFKNIDNTILMFFKTCFFFVLDIL